MEFPISYKVKARFANESSTEELKWQHIEKDFFESNPLDARKKAFDYFFDILEMLKQNGRITKHVNPKIAQSDVITRIQTAENEKRELERLRRIEEFKSEKGKDTEDSLSFAEVLWLANNEISIVTDHEQYYEYVRVYFVFAKEPVNTRFHKLFQEALDYGTNDIYTLENTALVLIHETNSNYIDEQGLIDNLEIFEVPALELYGCDLSVIKEKVYHYGEDYLDSGCDAESGAARIIIPTPIKWYTLADMQADEALRDAKKYDENPNAENEKYIDEIIKKGESRKVEFKPSLIYNFKTQSGSIGVKANIAKAVAAMLNTSGGIVVIGVNDNGIVNGLEHDYSLLKENKQDAFKLEVDNMMSQFFKPWVNELVHVYFLEIEEKELAIIQMEQAKSPVFLNDQYHKTKTFHYRSNASSRSILDIEDLSEYIIKHFNLSSNESN